MAWDHAVALEDARYARDRRIQKRRTNAGTRPTPWHQIGAELVANGRPKYSTPDLQDAVNRLPIEDHSDASAPAEQAKVSGSWQQGWAEEFPGEPWPGADEAKRRIREKNLPKPAGAA